MLKKILLLVCFVVIIAPKKNEKLPATTKNTKSGQTAILSFFNDKNSTVSIINTITTDVWIRHITDGKSTMPIQKTIIVQRNNYQRTLEVRVPSHFNPKHLRIRYKSRDQYYFNKPYPWPNPKDIPPKLEINSPNIVDSLPKNAYVVNDKIIFPAKKTVITRPLITPDDLTVVFQAGAKIDFHSNGLLISHGPIQVNGLANMPVSFNSVNNKGAIAVISANKKSFIKNAHFKNFSIPDTLSHTLISGGITFYESPLYIENVHIENFMCEDAINVIRSNVEIINCTFNNTFSDAIDIDFGNGVIDKVTITQSGNDGIDLSGSKFTISNVSLKNCGDKAISVGEASRVVGKNIEIYNCEMGIASKDLSEVHIDTIFISNSRIGIAAFVKKKFFGPATIVVNNLRIENCEENYRTDLESTVKINDR